MNLLKNTVIIFVTFEIFGNFIKTFEIILTAVGKRATGHFLLLVILLLVIFFLIFGVEIFYLIISFNLATPCAKSQHLVALRLLNSS